KVGAALGSACQVPHQPGVHVAEQRVAGGCFLARPSYVVEQPMQLETREIGRERQTGLGPQSVLPSLLGEMRHQLVGARVLPDERIVERFTRLTIPEKGGLTLVGYADGDEIAGLEVAVAQRA